MRTLMPGEILSLREFLSMETTGLAKDKTVKHLIEDDQLRAFCESGVLAAEGRIKSIQQFIEENHIVNFGEVQ